jgi:NTP pyrophosphatase (non-canonical NTP hydrolase)
VPTLYAARKKVGELVLAKGFGNTTADIPNKLLFAFIELGEAADSWKKGMPTDETIEELIDVIFYVLDASRLIAPNTSMDEAFEKKWAKNMNRPHRYGEGFPETARPES